MSHARIAVIILAAGASRRLGRPKQLLRVGGEPLIRHTVRHALASQADEVLVVLGNESTVVRAQIEDLGSAIAINPDFARGQSTSMVCGVSSLNPDIGAAILMLGDQPTVTPAFLNALINRFRSSGSSIVQPRYSDGRPGNPVLISRRLFPELLDVTGDIGARDVIRAHISEVEYVELDTPPPPDVDSEEDYQTLLTIWSAERGLCNSGS
jgi:molybdenum cofactor cytidylyltransferase